MKTRLCSLLLILSMVAATFTLLVTPAMAEEGVVNTTPAVAPAVKTDFSDIPADAWWDGSADTEFAGGDGTEGNPFQIATAAQLAYLSEITSKSAYLPYFMLNGKTIVASEGYKASQIKAGEHVYYLVEANGVNYLFSTTDGSNTAYPAVVMSVKNHYVYEDADGNIYYAVAPNDKRTADAYVYDQASSQFVKNGKVYRESNVYYYGTSKSGTPLTKSDAPTNTSYYKFVDASGNAYFVTSLPGDNKRVDAFVYDVASKSIVKQGTMYKATGGGYHYGTKKTDPVLTHDHAPYFSYCIGTVEGHALNLQCVMSTVGESGLFEYNDEYYYGWTNGFDVFDEKLYKVGASKPALDNDVYSLNGSISNMDTLVNSVYYASYKLTADIYFNNPSEYIDNWNNPVANNNADFVQNEGQEIREDFVVKKTGHFFTPIATVGKFSGKFNGNGHTVYGFATETQMNSKNIGAHQNRGLFGNIGPCEITNLTMAYAAVALHNTGFNGGGVYAAGTICGFAGGNSAFLEQCNVAKIDNCHVVSGNVYTGLIGGGIVGGYNGGKATVRISNSTFDGNVQLLNQVSGYSNGRRGVGGIIGRYVDMDVRLIVENCTVKGLVKTDLKSIANSVVQAGGIACLTTTRSNVDIINCANYADVISTTDAGVGGIVADTPQATDSSSRGMYIVNCINYGNVSCASGPAGGFAAREVGSPGTPGNVSVSFSGLRLFNCINYGVIKGTNVGQVVGVYGNGTAGKSNAALELRNCLFAGNAIAHEGGFAGAFAGNVQTGTFEAYSNKGAFLSHQLIIDNVYYAGNDNAFGQQSEEMIAYFADTELQKYINYQQMTGAATTLESLNAHSCGSCPGYNKYTWTSNKWVLDASEIQGASLQLGNSVAVNLYAGQRLGFEGWNDNKIAVSKAGEAKAELASLETVTIGGVDYFHYQLPVNPAEIGDTFTFTLNGNSIAYGVEAYAVRKYANGSAKLQGLLEALMAYGDAARVNKGGEAKSMAAIGKTYDASAIGTAYENLSMAPAEGGNVEGKFLAASLNLDGHINLLLQVAEDVANVKVSYTNQEGVVETTVSVVGGEAVYEGIAATALNLHYHLEALDAAGNVVGEMDWNVSRFIQNGLNSESFNDNQATLAKALALYMQSARVYTGLDVAAE